ncbi:long-chain fatty acid--CoA ligase [bacterium]|nr:long-chain fatty acid--CoA ligase [bacterium]
MTSQEKNLFVAWDNTARRHAHALCMRYRKDGDWTRLTYAEVDEQVRNFALGLLALGLAPGDAMALLSENRPCWAMTDLGVLCVGGVLAAIYPTSTAQQIGHIVEDSGAKILAVSNHFQLGKALSSPAARKALSHIIIFDPIPDLTDADDRVLSFDDVVNLGKAHGDPLELLRRGDTPVNDDLATLIYTSGTTGTPKGVMLTHANILSNVDAARRIFQLGPGDTSLSILPLSHSLERTAGHFAMLFSGAEIAYGEGVTDIAGDLVEVKPTLMIGVPRVFEKLRLAITEQFARRGRIAEGLFGRAMETGREAAWYRLQGMRPPAYLELQLSLADTLVYQPIRESFGGRLRFMISGGAPLSRDIAEFFFAAGLAIYEGYGLTETSPVVTANFPHQVRLGSVGKPIPGVEIRIADDGEVLVRGPNVMKGYHNLPDDTARAMNKGWFHTGDIGTIDEDGFLTITDRKKDIIVTSGGKNVAPQAIEAQLSHDRYIAQACVLGDRRPHLTAVIVPSFDEVRAWAARKGMEFETNADLARSKDVRELVEKAVDRVNKKLPPFERVRDFILADEEFTLENDRLTPTQKVRRRMVETEYAHRLDALY